MYLSYFGVSVYMGHYFYSVQLRFYLNLLFVFCTV